MDASRRNVVIGIVGVLVMVGGVLFVQTMLRPMLVGPPKTCRLMGCFNVLDVEFVPPAGARTIEVSSPGGETLVFDCPGDQTYNDTYYPSGCSSEGLHLNGYTPDVITVKITWEGGSKTETFRPVYQIWEPNGPGCGTCRVGKVTMTLP